VQLDINQPALVQSCTSDVPDLSISDSMAAPLYRYFLHQWPSLCVFACDGGGTPVGTIVAKVHSFWWRAVIDPARVGVEAHELLIDKCTPGPWLLLGVGHPAASAAA
jgi:hypothetical protein